jgi:uncharacterized protein YdeI (YjbR/CyaY-like superfamily)
MAAIVPNPKHIRPFATQAAFEAWLSKQHDKAPELWLKLYKKGSSTPTVTYAEALEVALCWGWIDGLKLPFDETAFLQRFTPRTSKSRWSQINVDKVEQLTRAGRMTPHGQKHIDAAKADGRWSAAYPSPSKLEVPADLLKAIEQNKQALATFRGLNRANLYALAYRMHNSKPEKRAERIAHFTSMLARGEVFHPSSPGKAEKKAKAKPAEATAPLRGAAKSAKPGKKPARGVKA